MKIALNIKSSLLGGNALVEKKNIEIYCFQSVSTERNLCKYFTKLEK